MGCAAGSANSLVPWWSKENGVQGNPPVYTATCQWQSMAICYFFDVVINGIVLWIMMFSMLRLKAQLPAPAFRWLRPAFTWNTSLWHLGKKIDAVRSSGALVFRFKQLEDPLMKAAGSWDALLVGQGTAGLLHGCEPGSHMQLDPFPTCSLDNMKDIQGMYECMRGASSKHASTTLMVGWL